MACQPDEGQPMERAGSEYGFIVVYPSGTGFPWRWRVTDEPDKEVAFISDLISKLEDDYDLRYLPACMPMGSPMAAE